MLRAYFRVLLGQSAAEPGLVICVHTFGNLLNFHPHLHVMGTDGGFTPDGGVPPVADAEPGADGGAVPALRVQDAREQGAAEQHLGSLLTATLIQLAVPSDISGYFFGLLGCQAHMYLGALVFAELPYAPGAVYLGSAFVRRQYRLLLPAAAVAAAAYVWCRLRHRTGKARTPP